MAIKALPARSCIVDCEAIVCNDDGLSVFDLIRYRRKDHLVSLCAFDLLELNGQDLRDQPLEERKAALKMLLRRSHPGIAYNRHFDVEGSIVFYHACKLGCEGIVSKRLGSPYRAGRSAHWLKRSRTGGACREARDGRGLGHPGQAVAMTSRRRRNATGRG